MGDYNFWTVAGILLSLSGLILTGVLFFVKYILTSINTNQEKLGKEISGLRGYLDDKIEKMYERMDLKNKDLKDYIASEISNLKLKDSDNEIKIDNSRERINEIEKNLLKLENQIIRDYQRKNGH